MLLERRGEVVTREELHQRLWSTDTFVDFDHGLNNAINRLREALSDSAETPRFIETLPRRGYRFVAPVEDAAPAAANAASAGNPVAPTSEAATLPMGEPATKAPQAAGARLRLRSLWMGALALGATLAILAGLNVGAWRQRVLGKSGPPKIQSIAVLPLENLSGDPAQDYFVDGMTDALITDLAQISALRVISRTSVMQYKGTKKPLREIARELNVDAIVEGAVVRSGDRVRISSQLIQAATDRHLWAKQYERDVPNILALQSEVAQALANEIQVKLTPKEQARLARSQRINSGAYDLYLRAPLHVGLANREDNQAAVELLEQAVAIDPNFAPAYAALGREYRTKAFTLDPEGKQWEEKAFAAVEKALSLDPELGEAYVARGYLLWSLANHYPHERAAQDYRRALALNPNLAETHHQLANVYNHIGLLDKGFEEAQRAVALDPRNTGARFRVGINLLYQGKYEESLTAIRDSERFFPSLWAFQTSFALYQLGRKDEAAARVDEFLKKYPQDSGGLLTGMQALFAAAAGDRRRAEERIQNAVKIGEGYQHFHHTAYIIASAYALMNKPEPAMKYLQRAAEDGFPCYPLYDRDADLNNLRKNPRFVQFMADLKKQWEYHKANL
jgi:TolB-like protein/DNA-binding winged helix-turn-helix (wHTH) protein